MKSVKNKKVVVAISGGLDSSAAAFLAREKGYNVIGVFMRLGAGDYESENCARRLCQKLGIKFYPINLINKFKKNIIKYFLDSYQKGLTPNPCVKCNKIIKFGELFNIAKKLGVDYIATGHYAKIIKSKKNYKLFRAKDNNKDQSYFLYNLNQEQLQHILFPLMNYSKEKVKKIAVNAGLPYLLKESQDICFLRGDHNDFLKEKINLKSGLIKTLDGAKIGIHKGLPLYTIGQRRGIEIGGVGPFYALKCDYKDNILYVAKDKNDPVLYSDELILCEVNWISKKEHKMPFRCDAVIRYRHKIVSCEILKLRGVKSSKIKENCYLVKFKEPQRAVACGQSVVFYKNNEVLGGGIIYNNKNFLKKKRRIF